MQAEVSGIIWNYTNAEQDSHAPSLLPDTLQCLERTTGPEGNLALQNGTAALGSLFFSLLFPYPDTMPALELPPFSPLGRWKNSRATARKRKSHLLDYNEHTAYQRPDYFRQAISFHVAPLSKDHCTASPLFLQSQRSFNSLAYLHFQSSKIKH